MNMTRRRYLSISAAALVLPRRAEAIETVDWHGHALGAEVRLEILGLPAAEATRLMRRVGHVLKTVEARFSLFRASELVRLNRTGLLVHPSATLRSLLDLSGRVHRATVGAFDPTVQVLWAANANGRDPESARQLVGWDRVQLLPDRIQLAPGSALTLNGIAQGHAADRIAALMRREGLGNVMIDTGEIAVLGRKGAHPWQVGIAAPDGALLARRSMENRVLATSSPAATRIGPKAQPHIFGPGGQRPRWNTVSVSAPEGQAALADALSTAFCLMNEAQIERALAAFPGTRVEYRA